MCKATHSIVNFEGVTKNVTSVGFNADGRWMYSGGEDGYCRVWDLKAPGQQCQKFWAAQSSVNTAFLHPNQYEIYFGDQNGRIYTWDLRANKAESILVDNDIIINHLSIEPEGNCLACVDNRGNCYTFSLNLKYANNGNAGVSRMLFASRLAYLIYLLPIALTNLPLSKTDRTGTKKVKA